MSARASIPTNYAELLSTASNLWTRTTSNAKMAGAVAKSLPTHFDPTSQKANLGFCRRLLEWALLETSYALDALNEQKANALPLLAGTYISTCDEQQQRLLACLLTATAIYKLFPSTGPAYERLLLSGIIPDLDEQIALLSATRTGARASHAW